MTIKQKQRFFSNAVEKLIAEMPDNLSEIEKARYVYVSVGKLFCFDEKYMFGKAKLEKTMYKVAQIAAPSFSDLNERRRKKSVCIVITKTLNAVLKRVGIDAESVREDFSDKHESTIFRINGQPFKADLTEDLKFIHMNLPTRHFAVSGPCTLTTDELAHIDSKIGYSYSGRAVVDKALNDLQSELSSIKDLGSKISRILEVSSQIPGVKELDYMERDSFYEYMISHIISSKEKKRLYKNILYLQKNKERDGFVPVYSTYDTSSGSTVFRRFLYSDNEKRFVEVSDSELQSFISENNYHLYYGRKIPGLNSSRKPKDKSSSSSDGR